LIIVCLSKAQGRAMMMKLILISGVALSAMTATALANSAGAKDNPVDQSVAAIIAHTNVASPMILTNDQMEKVTAGHFEGTVAKPADVSLHVGGHWIEAGVTAAGVKTYRKSTWPHGPHYGCGAKPCFAK
jgi:hypothetical protein